MGWRLSFDRLGLLLGPVVLIAWLCVPSGLSPEAHRLLGILGLTVIWWVTEPIPIAATGLFALVLCVVLGAVPADSRGVPRTKEFLAPFADPSVFFLLGGMFIGRAMTRHGLDRRIALAILCSRWASRSPAALLFAVGLSVTLVSMWISNTAATAMVYPVTLGIIGCLATGREPSLAATPRGALDFERSPYASMLLVMTAYASSVGGVATPIGTGTNVVARGFFQRPEYLGQSMDFLRWMLVGVPLMALLFIFLYLWLHRLAPTVDLDLPQLREYLHEQQAQLGPWKRGEVNTLLVFLIVVTLWVMPGLLALLGLHQAAEQFRRRCPEDIAALLAPCLLFLLPVRWRDSQFSLEVSDFSRIDWGTIMLFGSGMALGSLMVTTGLANTIGQAGFELLGTADLWVVTALAIASGIILSEFTGNAAAASALIPVVWSICREAGIEPIPPLIGVTFGASFGSALPVSTPPNAIVYGSGLIPVRRMIVAGVVFDVLCGLAIWLVLRIAWALGWSPFAR
ncbi:MAG: SLC13/DASS family transporter [Planctomycetia bacterium]|nr:SLC13/DASS family transporter [Planctomycetia bacterium]